MRVAIIDDEKRARGTLKKLIGKCSIPAEIIAEAENISEGQRILERHAIDLVFLDIKMPGGSGIDLLHKLTNIDFDIVFTTAHDEYAITAIKFGALDYLLKPIDLEELRALLIRFSNRKQSAESPLKDRLQKLEFLFQKHNKKVPVSGMHGIKFINAEEIIRCEADNNYTILHMQNGDTHMTSRTLKDYDILFRNMGFFRCHRTHLINLEYITEYHKGKVGTIRLSDGSKVELAESRRAAFLKLF